MTPLYRARKPDGRAGLCSHLPFLIIGVPAVAQQAIVSAPLSADEVIGIVVEMNDARSKH
jgi:hypothetical protein